MPASSRASSNNLPAGPTNGLPVRSSSFPGCSPTKRKVARLRPSPKTVCVPFSQRSQALQSAAAALRDGNDSCSGKNFSAEVAGKGEGFLRLAIWFPWLFVTLTTSGLGNVSMRWFRFKGSFSVVNLIR